MALTGVTLAACSAEPDARSDGGPATEVSTSQPDVAPADGPLPPEDTAGLAVEPLLAALYSETGTQLTRGAVIERRVRLAAPGVSVYGPSVGSGGVEVLRRPHLALYLAFVDEDLDDLDRYLDAVAPLTRVFADAAFERWPDLASFDICLVPSTDSDEAPEPAIALIDVTRDGFARWVSEGPDLTNLRTLTEEESSGVRMQLSAPLSELVASRDAAGSDGGGSGAPE